MSDWMIWAVVVGVLVAVEMFSGTFYMLMVATGALAGGIAALAGASGPLQLILASGTGVIATYGLRRSRLGRTSRPDPARDPNVNLDIGQTVTVGEWHDAGSGTYTARAMYRGALWDIELQRGGVARSGPFVIREIRGSRLIVDERDAKNN
jgi:membrane protein implicated in regulation of membrane protease activity